MVTELSGMEGHLDPVVAVRERLVDGVRDHLVDEMVEPARAGRADVHPGPKPDRLEAFENSDVLCGVVGCVIGFGHEKSPANSHLAGREQCIRKRGRSGFARGSPQRLSRRSRGARRPRSERRRRRLPRRPREPPPEPSAGSRRSARPPGPGSGPARIEASAERPSPSVAASRSRIELASIPSWNAQTASLACTTSTPSRPIRAGHARLAFSAPTAAGQAATIAFRLPAAVG